MGRARRLDNLTVTLTQLCVVGIGFASAIALSRLLGPSGRGGLATLQTVTATAASVGMLGLPYLINRRRAHATRAAFVAFFGTLAASLTFVTAVAIYSAYTTLQSSPHGLDSARLLALFVGVNAALQISVECVAAYRQSRLNFMYLALLRILWAILPNGAAVIVAASGNNVETVFSAFVAGTALNFIVGMTLGVGMGPLRLFRRIVGSRQATEDSRSTNAGNGAALREALSSHFATVLLMLLIRLDVLLVGGMAGQAQVGIYAVAYMAAEAAWMVTNGFSITILPRFIGADLKVYSVGMRQATRVGLLAAIAVSSVVAAGGYWAIPLIFGAGFEGSYMVFLLLVPGILAFVPYKVRSTALLAQGRGSRLAAITMILLTVNVALNLAWIPVWGAAGAAAATSVAYALGAMLLSRRDVLRVSSPRG